MVKIAVTSERGDEPRVAVSPETVKKFVGLGCDVVIERGAGTRARFSDAAYETAGAKLANDAASAVDEADVLLSVGRPSPETVEPIKPDGIVVAMLDPYSGRESLEALAQKGRPVFAME